MGLNQYPDNYIIVSPICFISCKSQDREVVIRFRLPHAASVQAPEYRNKVCILSTMSTSSSRKNPNTPLFTPTDRKLTPLDVGSLELEFDIGAVIFKLKLLHPALFAVAIIRGPIRVLRSIPIPLRCSLYVLYKVHDGTGSLGQIMVYAYVALKLKTVDTVSLVAIKVNHSRYRSSRINILGIGSSGLNLVLSILYSICKSWRCRSSRRWRSIPSHSIASVFKSRPVSATRWMHGRSHHWTMDW